ncbi:MBL fold metallo-hydrolase [Rhizobium sp. S95]|uniref:MBL fold metallo-hydrolase n=1 Tax=Ciceribacter sichuanensis TaxID=2949647 RepID=A0AAJ1BZB2_9HYPH|nr:MULTISPECIES: MBL fold metallo-hydrolase [unclassified Ciceribacter]MCM2395735.1 MBL fold metallo-hydrolase [Ciceribacter sp. S95]MCO5958914.1 MBL fold metallo-hydrolase [Ciceribacter sp. S101]
MDNITRRNVLKAASALATVAAVTGAPSLTLAAAPKQGFQAPGFYRMALGDLEITALLDGTLPLPLPEMYRDVTAQDAAELLRAAFRDIPTDTSVNAFLVNDGKRLVMIDAGTGAYLGKEVGHLASNLEASGYSAAQIDHIILTHVHTDHSGGLVRDGKVVFENATVHVPKRELDFWLKTPADARPAGLNQQLFKEAEECLRPYLQRGKVESFKDDQEVIAGFRSILRPGHTPGHSSIVVESGGKKLVFWGDITHGDIVQFKQPEVTIEFDVDRPSAVKSRKQAFAEAIAEGYLVAGAHIAFPGIGNVLQDGQKFDWIPVNYSDGEAGVIK